MKTKKIYYISTNINLQSHALLCLQSYICPSASKSTLEYMGKCITRIHALIVYPQQNKAHQNYVHIM